MLFNSIQYMIFLPIVFFIYYILPHKFRNIFLLIASLYFYGSWMPKYLILICGTIFITYLTSILIDKYEKHKKFFLFLGIIINILILIVFKYKNFFIDNINSLFAILNLDFSISNKFNFMLPVGISFYTFQSIGYCIDVYRKDVKCEKNFINYAVFVTFFPQLVAGPIERSKNLLRQFNEKHDFKYEKGVEGLRYILAGMYRKVVIADLCAVIVNGVYNNIYNYRGILLLFATFLFAIQIYCDFSGYSMIAIGSGKLLGFDLMENFKSPYLSSSVKEFWNRWHISLSTWFRDYIYYPLGGSKKGTKRKMINLAIVFLISGLWHGAAWTFVIWGMLHAFFRIMEEIKFRKIKREDNIFTNLVKILFTFIVVNISWVFFRANKIEDAIYVFKNAFNGFGLRNIPHIIYNSLLDKKIFASFIIIIIMISIFYLIYEDYKMKKYSFNICDFYQSLGKKRYLIYLFQTIMIIIVFVILQASYGQTGQFIYFQF